MTRSSLRRRAAALALLCLSTFSLACKEHSPKSDADGPAPAQDEREENEPSPKTPPTPAGPLPEIAPPTTDSAPVADRGQVVATVQLPTGSQLADISPIVDKFAPGTSGLLRMQFSSMLAQSLGMKTLRGARLDGPVSLVAVDPSLGERPVAVLVEVEDEAKLGEQAQEAGLELAVRDGRGLLGPAAVVAAAEAYAFTNLANYPDHTEIVFYPSALAGAVGPKIDEFLAAMEAGLASQGSQAAAGQEMMRMYAKGFVAAIDQTERAVISISQGQQTTDLHLHLYPVAGSTLASFVEAQVPSDHALLSKLPADVPQAMLMSGQMRAGAARDALIAFSLESMGSMYGGQMSEEEWMKLIDAWLESLDGEVAMAMNFNFPKPGQPTPGQPGMMLQGLFGTTDSAAMFAAWRAMLAAMVATPTGAGASTEMMGMKVELAYDKDVLSHDGVAFDRYGTKIDLEAMPPAQREAIERMGTASQVMHLAAFDSYGAMVSAGDEGEAMKGVIDAARGKGATFQAAPGLATTLATSTAREESILFFFDISAVAPPESKVPFATMTLAMGKHDGALTVRLSAS